jgi:peptide deformylase
MAKLEIKKYGDLVLRKKTDIVFEITDSIKNLVYNMLETMYLVFGVGLAAPQVGVSLKLCVVDVDPKHRSQLILINPEIISGEDKLFSKEGCLSLPGFFESIGRFDKIFIKYADLRGEKHEIKVEGLVAKVVQHEVDHLNAKLFIDYLPKWKRKCIERKIKKKKKLGGW